MSKADAIQKKLWKAYGKVALSLGRQFDVYRSDSLNDPIDISSFLMSKMAAFSLDSSFGSAHGEGVSNWQCWVDGRLDQLFDVAAGDILHNPVEDETYIIVSTQPLLPIRAIKAQNRITVYRAGYTTTVNGFGPGDVVVVSNVPCQVLIPSSASGALGYIPAGSFADVGLPNYEIHLYDPLNTIKIKDSIVDENGNRSQVIAVYHSDGGTKISTKAYAPK